MQGRTQEAADLLAAEALKLEEAGIFSLVLECVPSPIARKVTQSLGIPTIGIGAGPDTDGQVLVLQDMLGLNGNFKPKFLRQYLAGQNLIGEAVENFVEDVKAHRFPSIEESYE